MKFVKKVFGNASNIAIVALLISLLLVAIHVSDKYGYSKLLAPAPKKLVIVEEE